MLHFFPYFSPPPAVDFATFYQIYSPLRAAILEKVEHNQEPIEEISSNFCRETEGGIVMIFHIRSSWMPTSKLK